MQAANNRMRTMVAITTTFCLFLATSDTVALAQASPASEIVNLTQAADAGDGGAMFSLGMKYLNGSGVQQDDAVAAAWFRKAADAGDPHGMANLGWCHETGRGVPQSNADAVAWYYNAAEAGVASAMTNLGVMLRLGRGVEWNEPEAMQWFKKAAEMGDMRGQTQLGLGYMNGLGGGPQDYKLAAYWFTQATNQRVNPNADLLLGVLYQNGWGIQRDLEAADYHYFKAVTYGDSEIVHQARERSKELQKQFEAQKKDKDDAVVGGLIVGAALLAILVAASSSSSQTNSQTSVGASSANGQSYAQRREREARDQQWRDIFNRQEKQTNRATDCNQANRQGDRYGVPCR